MLFCQVVGFWGAVPGGGPGGYCWAIFGDPGGRDYHPSEHARTHDSARGDGSGSRTGGGHADARAPAARLHNRAAIPALGLPGSVTVAAFWHVIINYFVLAPPKSPKSIPRDPPRKQHPRSPSSRTKHSKTIKTFELCLGLIRWKDIAF